VKNNLLYALTIIFMCVVVIWFAVMLVWSAGAAWVPPVSGYDPGTDYMAHMIEAAEDGGEYAMALGAVYEGQRNAKIRDLGMEYETTDFFGAGDNAKTVLEKLREYIATPEAEPEDERAGWQSLGVWDITAYTWTGNPCANGEYHYEGLCAVNGLPFGTVIYVDGWGYLTVADRGGMAGWYDVDIYLDSEAACWEYGRRTMEVWIVG
jgi:3D (Asp-Asp-Asp) domain-containing protein